MGKNGTIILERDNIYTNEDFTYIKGGENSVFKRYFYGVEIDSMKLEAGKIYRYRIELEEVNLREEDLENVYNY